MTDNEIIKALAEIERLKKATEEAVSCFNRMESLYNIKNMELKVAKTEAIKEFAERLKKDLRTGNVIMDKSIADCIDNLVKEMTKQRKEDEKND